MKYSIEPIMGWGRAYGYDLLADAGTDREETIGKFKKRKWAEEMKRLLQAATPTST